MRPTLVNQNWWFIYFTGIWKWYFGSRSDCGDGSIGENITENQRSHIIPWPDRTPWLLQHVGNAILKASFDAVNQLAEGGGRRIIQEMQQQGPCVS